MGYTKLLSSNIICFGEVRNSLGDFWKNYFYFCVFISASTEKVLALDETILCWTPSIFDLFLAIFRVIHHVWTFSLTPHFNRCLGTNKVKICVYIFKNSFWFWNSVSKTYVKAFISFSHVCTSLMNLLLLRLNYVLYSMKDFQILIVFSRDFYQNVLS